MKIGAIIYQKQIIEKKDLTKHEKFLIAVNKINESCRYSRKYSLLLEKCRPDIFEIIQKLENELNEKWESDKFNAILEKWKKYWIRAIEVINGLIGEI